MTTRTRRRLAVERLERRDAPSVSPVGPEFRANAFTDGSQSDAAVAMDADGDFVVAWTSNDFDGRGIRARRYNAAGVAYGNEFDGNVTITGNQTSPAVAANAAGDFVVVWQSAGQDGNGLGVYGRRFSAGGAALGGEFRVGQTTAGDQAAPAVACDFAGNFVVTWQSFDGDGWGVFARRYDAGGTALGGEARVNTFTAGEQFSASVDMNDAGQFVVAWQSEGQDGSGSGIYAQRFTAAGTMADGEFRVNAATVGNQTNPAVGVHRTGGFVVAWEGFNEATATSGPDILGQQFSAAGLPVGEPLVIAGTDALDTEPAVAHDAAGTAVVAWTKYLVPTNATFVSYRTVSADGGMGTAAQVNTYVTNEQHTPAVACDAEGDFVIVWSGEGAGDASGVFGQRYDESVDAVLPRVLNVYATGLADPVAEGDRLIPPPAGLVVAFTEDMSAAGGTTGVNSVTNPANWTLLRIDAGGHVPLSSIAYGFNTATCRFEAVLNFAGPLAAGRYALLPLLQLRDMAGFPLIGEGLRQFTVRTPVPVGPERPVNEVAANAQSGIRVAADAAGNTVAVWQSRFQDGSGWGVYARRYSAAGEPLGDEFRVNTYTAGDQANPDVAVDADGDFVVAWESDAQDGSKLGVFAQRFSALGVPQGAEFRVNQTTAEGQDAPAVAVDAAGNFVVAWKSIGATAADVFARRYTAAGVPLGDEFRINVATAGDQSMPDVAADADGDFVVAWADAVQDGSGSGVYARLFDAYGTARGGEFRVNVAVANPQTDPAVAMGPTGDFLVAWESAGQDGSGLGVFARQFAASGVALTGDVAVNVATAGDQANPTVGLDADGDATVAWASAGQDGSGSGVYARFLDAAGNPVGGEFLVNAFTTNDQGEPAVAMEADGDPVIAWTSGNQDGSSDGVYVQRFASSALRVAGVTVNAGQANAVQRSRVTAITVTFDQAVTFAGPVADAFVVSRVGGSSVGGFTATAAVVNGVTVVTLSDFTGAETQFGSLADGYYKVTVIASRVTARGQPLDGNGDGAAGDSYVLAGTVANGLYRLFGDMNADGVITGSDFSQLRNAYGSSTGQSAYIVWLDFNGDGAINAFDFGQLRNRFGSSVP